MSTFNPISFVDFSAFAISKGYNNAEAYSRTGYLVYAKNGIRIEFQNTRGGVFGVGYRNRKDAVEAVFKAIGGANNTLGLSFLGRITGSFNFRATNLEDFFALVEAVGAIPLPVTIRGLNSAPAPVKAPALVPFAGSEKAKGRSLKGELSPEEIAKIGSDSLARLEAKKGKIA